MKFIFMLCMVITLGLSPLFAAEKETTPTQKEITVKLGQEVVIDGEKLRLEFSQLLGDSRCPVDVDCIWQGNAEITIGVGAINKRKRIGEYFKLNTALEPQEVKYKNYTIKFVKLSPDPKAGVVIDPSQYEATLLITNQRSK